MDLSVVFVRTGEANHSMRHLDCYVKTFILQKERLTSMTSWRSLVSRALKVLQERCCILKFAKEQELMTVPSRGNQFHRK